MDPHQILQISPLEKFNRNTCALLDSLRNPLYDALQNYLNPCFLASAVFYVQGAIGLVMTIQIFTLLFRNSYGIYRIKYSFGNPWNIRSVGVLHFFRLTCALLQTLLYAVLIMLNPKTATLPFSDAKFAGLLALFSVTLFFVIPLHFLETTRSAVGHGSLITYWLFSTIAFAIILVLDFVSPYKVYIPAHDKSAHALAYTLEVLVLVNAVCSFVFEVYLYSPSAELKDYFELNDWDIYTVKNLIYTLTFKWLEPILQKVEREHTIEVTEIPNTIVELKSDVTISQVRESWAYELKRAAWWRDRRLRKKKNPSHKDSQVQPSLFLTLLRVHYQTLALGFCGEIVDITCATLAPFLLQGFILFIYESSDLSGDEVAPPVIRGFAFAFGIFLCSFIKFISFNQYFITFFRCSFSIKSAMTCLIYEKALKLSPEAKKEKSTGDIVNHVAVDVNDIASSLETCSDAVAIPLRLFFCLAALHRLLGNAMWAGLATTVILVPLSTRITTMIYSLYNTQMEYKDARTRLTSEILNSIKSIKLYSWETPMLKKLDEVRNKKELVNQKKMGIYNAGSTFLWGCIPFVISCTVYSVYATVMKQTLTPSVIFPALSLFSLLTEPVTMLPAIFSNIMEAKVALERMSHYFILDEIEKGIVHRSYKSLRPNDTSVEIKLANFVWSSVIAKELDEADELNYALRDINFTAKKGQLTCVVGRVGAGKTTILKALIGEIPLVDENDASVSVNGTVAYCSQNPCILNTSIRENILFGKRYDAGFYKKTVDACQLTSDFEVLPNGDATLVGEKGISLSGGQKARVSLARALYSRADVYLLDDVLSAVDAHVGKKITKQVLSSTGLLSTKTLILATNSMKILRLAHETVFLEKGRITERGTFTELMQKGGEVSKLMNEFAQEDDEEKTGENDNVETDIEQIAESTESSDSEDLLMSKPYQPVTLAEVEDLGEAALTRVMTHHTIGATSAVSFGHEYIFEDEFHTKQSSLENKENKEQGHVKWKVYLEFLRACNWIYIAIWCLFFWAVVGMNIIGNWVLKYWSEKNLVSGHNVSPTLFLSIYAFTGVAGGFLTFASAYIIWTFSAVRSSMYFHDKMANSVLRSPMAFFDTTPIGRILNRFSDDISVLDQQVLWSLTMFVSFLIECFTRLAIVVFNLPFMLVVIVCLLFLYNHFRNKFMPASRELKRLKSALRSPVFSHLQESINGVETIRAYNEDERFIHSNRIKVDNVTKIDWTIQGCNRWLSMRLQFIAALIVLFSSMMILYGVHSGRGLSPSMVGFLMTYVFSSTSTLNAIIRLWAEVETKAVSLERLIEYGNLPSEAEMIIENNRPDSHWPATGEIHFKDYSTRYRENLDPVLRNINLDIKPAEKVGIVGRTGAGKSSLTLALFRIVEATTGQIDIDGINSGTIGLFDLRTQLNIIPQDAHAFEGTVRENLDPFGLYSDETLWKALEMAHLKEHVESMKTTLKKDDKKTDENGKELEQQVGLDARVVEGGSNLSSGQKQLLCLARALLKESKVLVLDEATAAVDVQTDKIIQETIRSEFKDKTILTIAHRLDTIMDSDRVLVLERGMVKEFDTPQNLLEDTKSEFYSLCKEGGYLDKKQS
ncbi:hypothetical protein METBIDRAFT_33368 [Metschnikowia bicuspidata var. bicuspidata NRRL YB-4993]|uniref:P-loop containing nucleoside triphosphate hydrolase protein n=1 Tax=Metschnikowia bicuspidata var. bicuspidata NRRL YB-4993 TaxID=869754 RepID=A0A1A0H5H6_9ASCO|nr:hypothetical protein METBIDRAFT_33368 [Metschnikowia bicuspidata var. bicuspidata NRRL YB-4993]OBA19157.1 hypothetical protein METBIDRAFT_33368 [Metschnikowia bicuspidata var. bicuspidata NRRL YB-4993]